MISVIGGVGLFLLGMAVMTDGLKALAGTALRGVLAKAAVTPLHGTFWGAVITLLVQSSSATTMTTIGLVSAGLLTFPQGLSLVFGANIGTTGTGWLVALFGVRVSLTAAALPIVFAGALLKLVGRGRWAGAGGAIAGFALILIGLTTLQQGMGGLADELHPADLPNVSNEDGFVSWSGIPSVLLLVAVGILMTAVMPSSTAAIAVSLSALYAGAVDLDQAMALVIGQNIGTATSSAVAAIGASSTAKRLAVAYIAFKLIAALIALIVFPFVTPLIVRLSQTVDSVTLLAAYHTAYNVVGVAILLPLMGPFTKMIERLVPERGLVFTKSLDPASLAAPTVAVEAVRRTVERVLEALCSSVAVASRMPRKAERPAPPSTTPWFVKRPMRCSRRVSFFRMWPTCLLPRRDISGLQARCTPWTTRVGSQKRWMRLRRRHSRPAALRKCALRSSARHRCVGRPRSPLILRAQSATKSRR